MTRKKTDAKKPADAKPEDNGPAEQEGSAARTAGAVVPGDGSNAAEGAGEKQAGAPGAADGTDGAPLGDAAPVADGDGKADEAPEGAGVSDAGEGAGEKASTPEDAGNGDAGDVSGGTPENDAAPQETVTLPGDVPLSFSTPLDDSNRLLALVADEAARVAYYGMTRVHIFFDTFDYDATTRVAKSAGPEYLILETKALVDKIGARATPEVCWTHARLAGVLADEMTEWMRIYFLVFVSVYLELKKSADQQRARIAAENAPAPPKKKIDPDDLTTGTVEGFGATIKTR